jgi:hypothetical protein
VVNSAAAAEYEFKVVFLLVAQSHAHAGNFPLLLRDTEGSITTNSVTATAADDDEFREGGGGDETMLEAVKTIAEQSGENLAGPPSSL